jgi:hypothetical protein
VAAFAIVALVLSMHRGEFWDSFSESWCFLKNRGGVWVFFWLCSVFCVFSFVVLPIRSLWAMYVHHDT